MPEGTGGGLWGTKPNFSHRHYVESAAKNTALYWKYKWKHRKRKYCVTRLRQHFRSLDCEVICPSHFLFPLMRAMNHAPTHAKLRIKFSFFVSELSGLKLWLDFNVFIPSLSICYTANTLIIHRLCSALKYPIPTQHAAPSSCGPSVYNFLHTSLLAHRILKWVLDFCTNFVPVSQSWGGPLAADHQTLAFKHHSVAP